MIWEKIMPGIQLLQKKNSHISISLKQISNIAYTNDYRQSIIFSNASFMVFNSSYEDYPITKYVIKDIIIPGQFNFVSLIIT